MSVKHLPTAFNRKISAFISTAINWISVWLSSIVKFAKASFLSLLIIAVILLLLTKMDQALTMLVDLVENEKFKWELLLAFFMLNALALALSHYPIYNYYAANLNNSAKFTKWYAVYPFRKTSSVSKKGYVPHNWLVRLFKVFIFEEQPNASYQKDERAHYLRYSIGLLIYTVWLLFVMKTFLPKLELSEGQQCVAWTIFWISMLLPLIHYIFVRMAVNKAKQDNHTTPLYRRLAKRFTLISIGSLSLLLYCVLGSGLFSRLGFFLILLSGYLFMFNYLYFRLIRTKLEEIVELYKKQGWRITYYLMKVLKWTLFRSEHYLLLFSMNFLIALGIIIWTTIQAIKVAYLPNATPILLAFLYAYYFIIAAVGKYFFAYRKLREQRREKYGDKGPHSLRFKLVCTVLFLMAMAALIGLKTESRVHELELVDYNNEESVREADFFTTVSKLPGENVFFIASHGGGLKSNAWTLHVLEHLQHKTNGKLLSQTVAFSGASGGSLGLALYTGLAGQLSDSISSNRQLLKKRIDAISQGNYTSSDLAMTFGIDSFRKLWPFNSEFQIQDRPYYSMIKYQSYVEDTTYKRLSKQAFRSFWKDVYDDRGYFPSLIMNTASTVGKRGVFWSVNPKDFDDIFHFSEDLAQLKHYNPEANPAEQLKTLSYFEAVSTTNRFPVFSPAAKIPGYGHYIDAGAIDNSGLLGCLDLYLYMISEKQIKPLNGKKVVFIEILNSKDLYVEYILNNLMDRPLYKDEIETDNIIADLQTALNLDKIPGYVSEFIADQENIKLIRIFMPHKITIGDVEDYLKGDIRIEKDRNELLVKLRKHNDSINSITEYKADKPEGINRYLRPWAYYEPTLSRHLSKSSLRYIEDILHHRIIQKQVDSIRVLLHQPGADSLSQ